ncbi:MAG TPA: hypothetical protein VIC27_12065, partial [Ktedonobacterales bacterium]
MLSTSRSAARDALGPAMIAAALAVVVALALRYFFAIPLLAELYADQATTRIPLPVFETMLTTFGSAAKHLYLISAIVAEAALMALAGVLYVAARAASLHAARGGDATKATVRAPERLSLTYADAPFIVLTLWLLSAGLLAPLLGGGFFGVGMLGGAAMTLLAQLAPDAVFALSLIWQTRAPLRAQARGETGAAAQGAVSRRMLLQQGTLAVITLGGGIAVWQALTSGLGALVGASPAHTAAPGVSFSGLPTHITPPPVPVYSDFPPVPGQSPEVTAASDFYYVSKNLTSD